jgi:hypothetical protein|tara:strand:- start:307 stop:588 length:282 start_codon:yes stop_codon:yes gene_type:complete
MTYPAPKYLEDDPWFGPAILSETQEILKARIDLCVAEQLLLEEEETAVPNNIHEIMYQIATSTGKTTTQLDPIPLLGGGSEQYQAWMSGSGFN